MRYGRPALVGVVIGIANVAIWAQEPPLWAGLALAVLAGVVVAVIERLLEGRRRG